MFSIIKKRVAYCWEWICIMFGFGLGVFLTLVGVVGFFMSDKPFSGCFEFMLYGPIIIFIVYKIMLKKRLAT
jgi:hypothetical protein